MSTHILGLDVSGNPRAWLTLVDAITYHAKQLVQWSCGDTVFRARGCYQKDGRQSIIETSSIIAVKSASGFSMDKVNRSVPLSNRTLFGRDRNTCAYCGREFGHNKLSRDHIVPKSRGGLDTWMNCVCSCLDCNCDKDSLLLEEAGMQLLYLPYVPNFAEKLILENRNVLADQMSFLLSKVPKHSRLN